MKHFNLKISGLVQGVGFRFFVAKKAEELKLKGFAENNPDGTVSVKIEGKEEELEKFIAWCREGPPGAKVKSLEIKKGN